jgi:hypothetical protein
MKIKNKLKKINDIEEYMILIIVLVLAFLILYIMFAIPVWFLCWSLSFEFDYKYPIGMISLLFIFSLFKAK